MLCGEFDPNPVAIINPDTAHEPIAGFPEICVGIFSKVIVDELVEKYGGEVIHYGKFCTGPVPIYRVEAFGVEAALFLPHVGAPAAAGFMEDIWAYGGRHFVYCGAAGALRRDIAHGHLIVPTAAIRDEGFSYHYLPPADEIGLKPLCVQAARDAMESLHYPYIEGKTWTTDAFFREGDGEEGPAPPGTGLRLRGDGMRGACGGGGVPGRGVCGVFLHYGYLGRPGVGRGDFEPGRRGACGHLL